MATAVAMEASATGYSSSAIANPDVAMAESFEAAASSDFAVTVQSMSGKVLAVVNPVPLKILDLKMEIQAQTGVPSALQKLVEISGTYIYQDMDILETTSSLQLLMVTDETALFSWQVDENPAKRYLQLEGTSIVSCPSLVTDYLNVLTKEPIRSGVHYFEFVMHYIGDEQWCGVVAEPSFAGTRAGGRSLKGWMYYCGRMGYSYSGSLRDGKGALHAEGRAVTEFKKLRKSGDTIGMLVDLDVGAIAFDLNGLLQGACSIPVDKPLYVLTHLDTPGDKVELRKPSLQDAPPANLEAMKGELLKVSAGEKLTAYGGRFDSDDDDDDDDDDVEDEEER